MRVLIVGGYGVFGGRLARLLAQEPRLNLLVAGRSEAKARAFCDTYAEPHGATFTAVRFDRDGDIADQLAVLAPDLVVDASGPFQAYGAAPFRLVEACIGQGRHYLDLADARDFVAGIAAFDDAAKTAGVYALSGTSTCPALTAAAVAAMTEGWQAVEEISAGIAPSPHAPVGEAVIQALASYAGRPIPLRRQGRETTGLGLVETRRVTIAPPGALPLLSTRFSLVETPDLAELPKLWPEARTLWFGAGPRPEVLHRMFNALARLASWGVPIPLARLSGLIHAVKSRLRWGEDRGGMYVRVVGRGPAGESLARSWNLKAEGDDGPFIPSMAAAALVLAQLKGRIPAPGARSAAGAVTLADYQTQFDRKRIVNGVRDELPATEPMLRRVLAGDWERLPAPVRAMHDLRGGALTARGKARIQRGANPLAAIAAVIMGFPKAGEGIPVTVTFERRGHAEVWTRDFAGQRFSSHQEAGTGAMAWLAVERFGPLACGMAMVLEEGRLNLIPRRWTVFGFAIPSWLAPRVEAVEFVDEQGRFRFDADMRLPVVGRVVRYEGWLTPAVEVRGEAAACR